MFSDSARTRPIRALAGFVAMLTAASAYAQPALVAKLNADDGVLGDLLGSSAAIEGDTVFLGAPDDTIGSTFRSGSVYVFERVDGLWVQTDKLIPPDRAMDNAFGTAVAVDGDLAVISALEGEAGDVSNTGAAYVYRRSSGVWTLEAKLIAGDADTSDSFGYSVAVSGNTILVGAVDEGDTFFSNGAVYVFRNTTGNWKQVAKLVASDPADFDYFGSSVALSGTTAIIGTPGDDTPAGVDTGSAYVFEEIDGVWTETGNLVSSDAAPFDAFGSSVAMTPLRAVVGAYLDDLTGANEGSAYIFDDVDGVWTETAKLIAGDAASDDEFGWRVDIDGANVAVAAHMDNFPGARDAGSAYVFSDASGAWKQIAKLQEDQPAIADQMGRSLGISGDFIIAGAWQDDVNNVSDVGTGYLFDLVPDPPPDLTITVTSQCPSGGTVTVSWTGATPGGQVALLLSPNPGNFVIPAGNPCVGTQLGLAGSGIRIVYQGGAGQFGIRTVQGNASPGTCGQLIQLLDIDSCRTSNVDTID